MGAVSRLAMVAAGLLVVLTGCTGDSAAPATSSTTSSTSTSTTQPSTSSTSPSSTTSTTTDPVSEVEAEIEAAYMRSYEVYIECYRTLPDCDPNEVFPEVYAPPTMQRLILAALERKADGLVYGPPTKPELARTEIFDIMVTEDMTTAVVFFCTFAGDQEYITDREGRRTLTSDLLLVEWGDATMMLGDDGVWRVNDYPNEVGGSVEFPVDELDQRLKEGTLCGGELGG